MADTELIALIKDSWRHLFSSNFDLLKLAVHCRWYKDQTLPALASSLVLEMYWAPKPTSGVAHAVRLVLQDGPGARHTAIPLPCSTKAGQAVGGKACDIFTGLVYNDLP